MSDNGEYLRELLERAFLVQQKRVWSLEMLDKLARKQVLAKGTDEQRDTLRKSLEANLRISKVVLDEIAKELGYESTIRKLLDPRFVMGAPGEEISQQTLDKFDRADTKEREAGAQHYASMIRELLVEHEGFLAFVQGRVCQELDMEAVLQGM
jgi:hypothetical protein